MLTSRRITANSYCRMSCNASAPDRAVTTFSWSSSKTAPITKRFSGRSSTTRMLTLSGETMVFIQILILSRFELLFQAHPKRAGVIDFLTIEPSSEDGQHLLGINRLGQVIPGARLDAPLPVAFHR